MAEEAVASNIGAIITVSLAIVAAVCAAFKILWDALMRQVDEKHAASLKHIDSIKERVDVLESELTKSQDRECPVGHEPFADRLCQKLIRRHFLPQTDKTTKTALEKHHE